MTGSLKPAWAIQQDPVSKDKKKKRIVPICGDFKTRPPNILIPLPLKGKVYISCPYIHPVLATPEFVGSDTLSTSGSGPSETEFPFPGS
jgi:hypothetical protein